MDNASRSQQGWFRKLVPGRSPTMPAADGRPALAAVHARAPGLALLAASIRSPHGASTEELAAALRENRARADLDEELRDDDGFPVMTARCADARDDTLQEEIGAWLAASGMDGLPWTEEQWRALVLATGVAGELAGHAASVLAGDVGDAAALELVPVLPADWDNGQRQAAGLWLRHVVAQAGWPAGQVGLPHDADVQDSPSALFARLARSPTMAIVIACASHIGDETVAQWSAEGTLFTSSRPQGAIPGEGAAGVLVGGLRGAPHVPVLAAVDEARRTTSADEARRAETGLLGEVADRVLARGGADPSAVATIVGDTGHRSGRALELMGYAASRMPQLDGTDDVVQAGAACGTCALVPFFTALALARHYALERAMPVLCTSNEDPWLRIAALVTPPPHS